MYDTRTGRSALRRRVLAWYRRNGRALPWRRTRDPYRILVSEVMLQQTQVARVVPAYARFLRRFPTLGALARAPLGDVLREWSGLGYNRRARDLHRVARATRKLPRDVAALDALPGIGAYTAGAVACFAHGTPIAFADTNIRRVLGRAVLGRTATDGEARALDDELMPRADAAAWHHALMDIGALFCGARRQRCAECPLRAGCTFRGGAEPARRRQSPFGPSDRRVRGAILRALLARARSLEELLAVIRDPRVPALVAVLESEGLVARAGAEVRLPR